MQIAHRFPSSVRLKPGCQASIGTGNIRTDEGTRTASARTVKLREGFAPTPLQYVDQ